MKCDLGAAELAFFISGIKSDGKTRSGGTRIFGIIKQLSSHKERPGACNVNFYVT